MLRKMLIQACICMSMMLAVLLAKNCGFAAVQTAADAALEQMSVNYTAADMKAAAEKTAETFAGLGGKVDDAVDVITGKPVYGEPIDEAYEGNETLVYAVGGGKVTSVGENEEIGKYVKITHGNHAESLYGNLKSVRVSTPVNVKKGQIIGVYEKIDGKDFYYSFKEF